MRRWKSIAWLAAGVLALGVTVTEVAPRAIAQIRAALVRDMDSPIRGTRYLKNDGFFYTAGGIQQRDVTITPVIPAGKKLFIQRISARTTSTTSVDSVRFSICSPDIPSPPGCGILYIPVVPDGVGSFIANQDIGVLVAPGDGVFMSLTVNALAPGIGGNPPNPGINYTVIGYFVDATP
jgi:hypothetical protein